MLVILYYYKYMEIGSVARKFVVFFVHKLSHDVRMNPKQCNFCTHSYPIHIKSHH